jgi:hypothetical protein
MKPLLTNRMALGSGPASMDKWKYFIRKRAELH